MGGDTMQLSGLKLAGMFMVLKGIAVVDDFQQTNKPVVGMGTFFGPCVSSFFRNFPQFSAIIRGFYAINT